MSEKLPRITADEVIRAWKELASNYRGRVAATKSTKIRQGSVLQSITTKAEFYIPKSYLAF